MYQTYNTMAILSNCNFMMVMSIWELEARKKEMRDRCCQQLSGIQRKMKWNSRRNAVFASPVQVISTILACSVKTLHCQNGLVVTVNKISRVRLGILVYRGKILFHWSMEGQKQRESISLFFAKLPLREWSDWKPRFSWVFNQKTNNQIQLSFYFLPIYVVTNAYKINDLEW